MFFRHPVLSLVTLGYLAVVGWVTLGPQPLDSSGRELLQRFIGRLREYDLTSWVTYNLVEFMSNAAMFVPIGILFVLVLGRRQWWLAVLLGALLSVAIELAQLFLINRVTDPRDILANSIGALIGVILALVITAGKARRIRSAQSERARERELVG